MNNKRTIVNLYKDIVLVTRVRIFCTTLFTNNNIKVVIQMHTIRMDLFIAINNPKGSKDDNTEKRQRQSTILITD